MIYFWLFAFIVVPLSPNTRNQPCYCSCFISFLALIILNIFLKKTLEIS